MKITISKIPGVFPVGYSEQFFDDTRSVKDGIDSFFVETAKRVQIINDTSYRKRKIQSVIYNRYTIKIITTESVDIDMLNYAGEVIITLDNSEQHLAEFIEAPSVEKLSNSEFRQYTLTYRDLYSKQTINHLVYNSSNNSDYYVKLVYNGGIKYTQIYPELAISELEQTQNNDNYNNMSSSESAYKTISATFYIEDSNIQDFIKELTYLNVIDGINVAASAKTYMEVASIKYIPKETPLVEIEDTDMEGIKPVKVTIKYEQILNYPFA